MWPSIHYRTGFQLKSKAENGADPVVEYFRKIQLPVIFRWRTLTAITS